jgi:protein arginine kinase
LEPTPLDPFSLADRTGGWLDCKAPDADVVVSCRVRLARNVCDFPFQKKLDPARAIELVERVQASLMEARLDGETLWVPLAEASQVLKLLLLERNLASRDLVSGEVGLEGRAVAFGHSETTSIMVGEEDHVRLSALAAGYNLELAWQRAHDLDTFLERQLPFAHSKKLGYLTACPTNVGTGLRASVMLHLPALGLVRKELEKVFIAAQHTGLAVRGMHGEGSRAAGDLYQISNQVTLGRTEAELIAELQHLVPGIVDFERRLRSDLVDAHRAPLRDRVAKSYGTLRSARALPTEEALTHLSTLRLGLHQGLLESVSLDTLMALGLQVQKGHILALSHLGEVEGEDASERDKLRASMLRARLAG